MTGVVTSLPALPPPNPPNEGLNDALNLSCEPAAALFPGNSGVLQPGSVLVAIECSSLLTAAGAGCCGRCPAVGDSAAHRAGTLAKHESENIA